MGFGNGPPLILSNCKIGSNARTSHTLKKHLPSCFVLKTAYSSCRVYDVANAVGFVVLTRVQSDDSLLLLTQARSVVTAFKFFTWMPCPSNINRIFLFGDGFPNAATAKKYPSPSILCHMEHRPSLQGCSRDPMDFSTFSPIPLLLQADIALHS
ncbi:hypothetical protein RRG08_039404 [Elysia crispata]|uniref:Uncharacterized protein n=1 Tax=Elysia crispata TaxID=231223 RepID=A0AAE0XWJ9_9GAST|nr:hypothetical protein RRG08_039404 [Elysia crispata]